MPIFKTNPPESSQNSYNIFINYIQCYNYIFTIYNVI